MLSSEDVQPILRDAFNRFLQHLQSAEQAPSEPLLDSIRSYFRLKSETGTAPLAKSVGLHEEELKALEAAARDVERTLKSKSEDASSKAERNAVLAQVRLMSWLETCDRNVPTALIGTELESVVSADVGHKQVRALELIVRSVITESYEDQEKLVARLREALSPKVVEKWQAKADSGDILSGLTFSELASLFVNKDEFARYETMYEDTPFLTLLKQRRRTTQSFLEDVRRIRNTLAHNKKVTNTQLTLLDLYYEEIVDPIQTAFDQGETKIDPGTFLEVSREDLDRYTAEIREDVHEIRDDLAEFRADVSKRLGVIAQDTSDIKKATTSANIKLYGVLAGVAATIVLIVLLTGKTDETKKAADEAREAGERTEEVARETGERALAAKEAAERTAEAARRSELAAKATATKVDDATTTMKETADKTNAAVNEVKESSDAAKEAAEAAREAAEASAKSTERIAETLEGLKESFNALTKEGGVIVDADKASAHYHNARIYEQRGDTGQAMDSYRKFFGFPDLGVIDPHLRYQELLKLQNGLPGAREIYHSMKQAKDNMATEFAWMLLLPREARIENLTKFTEAHEDFAPAFYALSRDYSYARLGAQTLDDKRQEKKALSKFIELKDSPGFLARYLDQSVAAKQIEDTKQRLAALASVADTVLENPVTLQGTRSNSSWMLYISIAETTKEIFWRIGDDPFQSTGHLPNVHPTTGLPMARPMINLPLTASQATIDIKYVDPKGKEHGPYAVEFNPMAQAIKSTKNVLAMTRLSWVSFRDYNNQLLVYFSGLLSWRGVLKEIRYGLNKEEPDTLFPFSKPDPKNPHAIHTDDVIHISVPKDTTFVSVQLTFVDGTTDKARITR